ncbi:MAG: GNAT family N-acetyltransferase [Candidatus Pacebacteria bacterium]|nr:GNAT family N-acetyltransferase [Candidatus Paceibacterota bacterium]
MKEEIKIKEVREGEIKEFADKQWKIIEKKCGFAPFWKSYFFGIYEKGLLRGYARVDIEGDIAEVSRIIIDDKFTDKGFGSRLMKHIKEFAKKNKCRKIVLQATGRYGDSIDFYKKHGFKVDATLKDYYFGCDWHYMGKSLK